MTDLAALQRANDKRWTTAQITGRLDVTRPAATAEKNKSRYIEIVHRLQKLGSNMPDEAWVFVAACHYRESNFDFNTHLGQGDPLSRGGVPVKTVHVPANRGPFHGEDAFEQAAVDALWVCAPYAARANKDWTISGMLTYLERYNGLKYASVNRPSPYVWSDTTAYDPPGGPGGKVMVDHGPIANVVDKQLGVAALLKKIDQLDDTIDFGKVQAPATIPNAIPTNIQPVQGVRDAAWLQWSLNQLGASIGVDGVIGLETKTAVKAFQLTHALTPDGIAGTVETIPAIVRELKAAGKPEFPTVH